MVGVRILGGRKTGLAAVLVAALACAAPFLPLDFSAAPPATAQDVAFFRIATGASQSLYFAIGGLLASAISNPPGSRNCEEGGSCGVPGLIAVAQTTGGAVANVEAVAGKSIESGLTQSDVAHFAFTGAGVFANKGKLDGLRALANLYQESLHLVVRRGAKIAKVADLAGKRVSLGEDGSGTGITARLLLRAYGLSDKKIRAQALSSAQAAEKIKAKKLDAFFAVGGAPIPAVTDLAAAGLVDILPLAGDVVAKLRDKYPFLTVDIIPAETYPGIGDTVTLGVGVLWVVSADLPEPLAYELTKALWHPATRQLLDRGHSIGKKIRFETALSGLPIPLHPGAQRYYTEAGAKAAQPPASE